MSDNNICLLIERELSANIRYVKYYFLDKKNWYYLKLNSHNENVFTCWSFSSYCHTGSICTGQGQGPIVWTPKVGLMIVYDTIYFGYRNG